MIQYEVENKITDEELLQSSLELLDYEKSSPGVFLDMNLAWELVKFVEGHGTQRGVVNVRGKFYTWHCYYKGVSGEGVAKNMPRAIALAVFKATRNICGGIEPFKGTRIPVIGCEL